MRTVEIVHDRRDQRAWVAVDCQTREQLLRVHDHDLLVQTCNRLGWQLRKVEKLAAQQQAADT